MTYCTREIVLDTETTGLDPSSDRIVEIGCVELVNGVATGRRFQSYVNPECTVPASSIEVHGLTGAFLSDKPTFARIAAEFLAFIGDAQLVMHNAMFDLGFLNAELRYAGCQQLASDRAIDTLTLARRKFPGAKVSLDSLCRKFKISVAARKVHGALTDALLLADVYLELTGGRQSELTVAEGKRESMPGLTPSEWTPKLVYPTAEEQAAHAAFMRCVKAC